VVPITRKFNNQTFAYTELRFIWDAEAPSSLPPLAFSDLHLRSGVVLEGGKGDIKGKGKGKVRPCTGTETLYRH